ncbi:MAG: cytochrome P450 [Proteobacteria bacterium]|nr:cytochrome P450 [Pseudomonadota bacterium]
MTIHYEPFSAEVRDDPFPHYARLREQAPLHWAEQAQAWCVSRFDDVRAVLRDPERFSSDAMRTFLMGVPPGADAANDPAAAQRMLQVAQALPFSMQELITSRNLISEDPPRHGVLRSLVNRGFTPRRIAAWEPRLRAVAEECMAKLRHRSEFDLVTELAIPLPVRIITEMLGVEAERQADFKTWSDQLVAGSTGSGRGGDLAEIPFGPAMGALCTYVQQVAARRRQVEEVLRWDGPVQFVFRRATCDVEIAGGRIPANSYVIALIGSANRDERTFGPTAGAFDVTRESQGHLAFGLGNHFCLGASLARLEAQIALGALLDELPHLEARDARVEFIDSFLVRGPQSLPLRRAA